MAWTTKVFNKELKAGVLKAQVAYLDDGVVVKTETVQVSNTSDIDWIKRHIKTRIDELQAAKDAYTNLTESENFDYTLQQAQDPTPDPVIEDFKVKLNTYRQHIKRVEMKLASATDTEVIKARNAVVAAYKPEYLFMI